jgi:hypothetical protein
VGELTPRLCPFYVPSTRAGRLYLCDARGLHGTVAVPTPEDLGIGD